MSSPCPPDSDLIPGAPAPEAGPSPAIPPRILIVEDELIVALDLQRRLQSFGYAVVGIAANGTVALELVRTLAPAAVLLDIGIQGDLDGIDVANQLRQAADIPVIFVTGNADGATLKRAEAACPYNYVLKPIREGELRIALAAALHHARMVRELRAAHSELEERVRQRTAELAEANRRLQAQVATDLVVQRELRLARAKAEGANRSKGRFFANLTHEIRTPMHGILGLTEVLSETRLTDEQRENVQVIQDCGHALMTIIDEILRFAALDEEPDSGGAQPIDVRRLFQVALENVDAERRAKEADLTCDVAPEVPRTVHADPERLAELLRRLLAFCLRTAGGAPVEVECACVEQVSDRVHLEISFRDESDGLSSDMQRKVQRVFTQPDAAFGDLDGLGLGLVIPSLLVRQMSGILWLETIPGLGNTVRCRLWLPTPPAARIGAG